MKNKKKIVSVWHYFGGTIGGLVEFDRSENGKRVSRVYRPGSASLRRLATAIRVRGECQYGGMYIVYWTGEGYK